MQSVLQNACPERKKMSNYHTSVLPEETIGYLNIKRGEKYIDATLGGGGHTTQILEQGGKVLGIDVDQEALDEVEKRIKDQKFLVHVSSEKEQANIRLDADLILVKGNFRDIRKIAKKYGFENVAGIIFDLGVSSHQIDDANRGFSFSKEGPLDMRMDNNLSVTAKDLVNGLHRNELIEIFKRFGEENFAHGIATEIVKTRKEKPIETTKQLTEIIERVMPAKLNRMAAAARIFQSLRIVVNDELHAIEDALPEACSLLQTRGKLIVISFHSLEDRIVKHLFVKFEQQGMGKALTHQPVLATEKEIAMNVRSRSAKLRVFEKI